MSLQEQLSSNLAEPFDRIFLDRGEADFAFDLFRDTVKRLRASGAYDPRLAVTLSERSGKLYLRLNFGGWLVIGFRGPGQVAERVDLALLADQVTWDERLAGYRFEVKEGLPQIRMYELPLPLLQPLTSELRRAYETTLDFIADKFQHWQRATHWKQHNPEIVEACFDPDRRDRLLAGGLRNFELLYEPIYTPFEGELVLAEEGTAYQVLKDSTDFSEVELNVQTSETSNLTSKSRSNQMSQQNSLFTQETFQLLEGLRQSPTKEYYLDHKGEFTDFVEKPFKQLMSKVASKLFSSITELMETKKQVFSRILKNDYGQGATWDFYWGAFYKKGSKRSQSAQLFLWLNHNRLEFGFYIGVHGSNDRQRFIRNVRQNREMLIPMFEGLLADIAIVYGSREAYEAGKSFVSLEDWLENLQEPDSRATFILPKGELLTSSISELTGQIVAGFTTLFPFVLLATSDTPLLEIEPYLAAIETDIVKVKSKLPATQPASPSISLRASLPTFQPSNPSASLRTGLPTYPLAQLSADTGYDEATLTRWLRALERKKQIILYGPPGTGKTFMAEKLASHRVGGSDGFIEVVQFHPAYAYEDFVQGLRPMARAEGGLDYPLVPGRFLRFCEQAAQRDGPCVLIIDEINRANLAGVFGELMVLLEYRERAIPLAAGGPPFQIPAKVRLIGTMNTADRSIALVDYALRRRFAFIALKPNLELLRRYHERHATGFKVEGLIKVLLRLNRRIDDPHYELGITFFLQTDLADDIGDIWQMEIEPYLEEYFFDQPETVTEFRWPQVWPEILGEG